MEHHAPSFSWGVVGFVPGLCSRTRKAAWPWLLPLGVLEEEGSSTSAVVLPWGAQALPLRGAGNPKLELV